MPVNIEYQLSLLQPLPTVYGPKDYRDFRDTLVQTDRIIENTGIEFKIIHDDFEKNGVGNPTAFAIESGRRMFRCAILKVLSGLDYRELAVRLADSQLYQWFTRHNVLGEQKSPAKSTLKRYVDHFDYEDICSAIHLLGKTVSSADRAPELLYSEDALDFDAIFADSRCVKAPIHFPVDWVLFRDAVRSLIKAIICIRKQGLKHRMPSPESFISQVNSLCIQMAQCRRKKDSKKARKVTLRKMKKLAGVVQAHAQSYHELLSSKWELTDWTQKEAYRVLGRIENIVDKLPAAQRQAHERIIGERKVASSEKLLSLYEDDIHVIVRGKVSSEVEFGNGLYLAEQQNGIIVDWCFFEDQPPSDIHIVKPSVERITANYGKPFCFTGDRGFYSKTNSAYLTENNIFDGLCPKGVKDMQERFTDEVFEIIQKRRAQTEGRIGILKNVYLGTPLRAKGFRNRRQAVGLSILTHNLWVVSCLARDALYENLKKAA